MLPKAQLTKNFFHLKAHRQIPKKGCFEKYGHIDTLTELFRKN